MAQFETWERGVLNEFAADALKKMLSQEEQISRLQQLAAEKDAQMGMRACRQNRCVEFAKLQEENRRLRSMCKAAAAEISEAWEAHCDDDGYGPVNLLARLEGKLPPDLYPAFADA